MNKIYEYITWLFDPLHYHYEHEKLHKKISILLVIFFLGSLLLIELNRQHLLPDQFGHSIPVNHFYAVSWAFTVILVLEVISLVFTLPCSFARSLGKQFEILSLILLRNAFKELSTFSEPITFAGNQESVMHILSDGFGAVIVFSLLGGYYILERKTRKTRMPVDDIFSFVSAKKGIALLLLFSFIGMGIRSLYLSNQGIAHGDFFSDFYTLLIITDILVVLIAQCFHPSFYSVFRNSGFALSTMMIRLALVAPVYYDILLGMAAILFAILLTVISGRFFPELPEVHENV